MGDVGPESAMVEVDLIGVVVEGLTRAVTEEVSLVTEIVVEMRTRVVLEVASLVIEIAVEGPTEVVLEVAALVVAGIVVGELTRVEPGMEVPGVVGTGVDTLTIFRQGTFGPTQEYPESQQESKHLVDPAPHGFRHFDVPTSH